MCWNFRLNVKFFYLVLSVSTICRHYVELLTQVNVTFVQLKKWQYNSVDLWVNRNNFSYQTLKHKNIHSKLASVRSYFFLILVESFLNSTLSVPNFFRFTKHIIIIYFIWMHLFSKKNTHSKYSSFCSA